MSRYRKTVYNNRSKKAGTPFQFTMPEKILDKQLGEIVLKAFNNMDISSRAIIKILRKQLKFLLVSEGEEVPEPTNLRMSDKIQLFIYNLMEGNYINRWKFRSIYNMIEREYVTLSTVEEIESGEKGAFGWVKKTLLGKILNNEPIDWEKVGKKEKPK
jgi:hypothetical protein